MSTAGSTQVGFLLADWDEKIGPQIIAQALPGITEDPESLAAQSYMSAQQVFCSAEFSRVSFVLPNLKIQRKVKLYFDVIQDDKVRGGQRPFLIAVFLPLSIPDAIFLKLDPIIEPVMEAYKKSTCPEIGNVEAEILKMLASDATAKEKKEQPAGKDQVLLINAHCEICKRDLRIAVSKTELRKKAGSEFHEYTYLHGTDQKGIDPHGVKITVNENYVPNKIEYVDVKGNSISPFHEQDMKTLPAKIGAWVTEDIQRLGREVKRGTNIKTLVQIFQRPITEIENKIIEIESGKITHFNKVLAEFVTEAKKVEIANRKEAKKLWLKIVEYCEEFIQSPGLAPKVTADIRLRIPAIKARAEKL